MVPCSTNPLSIYDCSCLSETSHCQLRTPTYYRTGTETFTVKGRKSKRLSFCTLCFDLQLKVVL